MTSKEKVNHKVINFGRCLTIMIAIWLFCYYRYGLYDANLAFLRTAGTTCLYFIIALVSDNIKTMKNLFLNTLDILNTRVKAQEKMIRIKKYLAKAVKQWNKYHVLYEKIVNGKKFPFKTKMTSGLKSLTMGTVSIKQTTYILTNFFYSVMLIEKILTVPSPFDFFIMVAFLTAILFSSGSVAGMSEVMIELFGSLKPKTSADFLNKLNYMQELITDACHFYYTITLNEDQNNKNK